MQAVFEMNGRFRFVLKIIVLLILVLHDMSRKTRHQLVGYAAPVASVDHSDHRAGAGSNALSPRDCGPDAASKTTAVSCSSLTSHHLFDLLE